MTAKQVEIMRREMWRAARGFQELVAESNELHQMGRNPSIKFAYGRNAEEMEKALADYEKANYFWAGFQPVPTCTGYIVTGLIFAPKSQMKEIMSRA